MDVDVYRSAEGSHAVVQRGKAENLPQTGLNWALWRSKTLTKDDRVVGLDTHEMLKAIESRGHYITTDVVKFED
jgi:hypothetical protein